MRTLLFVFALLLLWSCANQKPPIGGPEDRTPPQVIRSAPLNESAGINPQRIELEFDEFFKVNSLEQNLFISPYIDNPVEHKVRGRRLILTFEKPFEENTTYTLSFNRSIKDLTENNEAKNLRYVFSTGSFIDSLELTTEVLYPLTQKPCDKCIVGLQRTGDTTTFSNSPPLYYAFTDKKGSATLRNIAAGSYRCYTFIDENRNYRHDENELLSFIDSTLTFDSTHLEQTLYLITPDLRKQKLIESRYFDDVASITFNKGIDSLYFTDTSYQKLDLFYWLSTPYEANVQTGRDRSSIFLMARDSTAQVDTFTLNIPKPDTLEAFLQLNSRSSTLIPGNPIILQLANPPKTIVDSLIYFVSDSVIIPNTGWKLDTNRQILTISVPKSLTNINLHIDSAAIRNDRIVNNNFSKIFKLLNETETGILKGSIHCPENRFILDLLDNRQNVVTSVQDTSRFYFPYLPPGDYELRLKVDINGNGKWDAGSISDLVLPEPVVFHKGKINLRKNWEIGDLRLQCPTK